MKRHYPVLRVSIITLALIFQLSLSASTLSRAAKTGETAVSRALLRGYQAPPLPQPRFMGTTPAAAAATKNMWQKQSGMSGFAGGSARARTYSTLGKKMDSKQAQKASGLSAWMRSFFSAPQEPKPKGTGKYDEYYGTYNYEVRIILSRKDLEDMINRRKGLINSLKYPPIDLRPYSLKNADLSGLVFPPDTNFEEVNLTGATLAKATVPRGKFRRAILNNAILTDANMPNCDFWETSFTKAKADGAKFIGASFGGDYYGHFSDRRDGLLGVDFRNADFTNATFINFDVSLSNIEGAILDNVKLPTGTSLIVSYPDQYEKLPSQLRRSGGIGLNPKMSIRLTDEGLKLGYDEGPGFQYRKPPKFEFFGEDSDDRYNFNRGSKQQNSSSQQATTSYREQALTFFGLKSDATKEAIKQAYRAYAHTWHPDKFATASEKEKQEAHTMMSKGNEAYALLMREETK